MATEPRPSIRDGINQVRDMTDEVLGMVLGLRDRLGNTPPLQPMNPSNGGPVSLQDRLDDTESKLRVVMDALRSIHSTIG